MNQKQLEEPTYPSTEGCLNPSNLSTKNVYKRDEKGKESETFRTIGIPTWKILQGVQIIREKLKKGKAKNLTY